MDLMEALEYVRVLAGPLAVFPAVHGTDRHMPGTDRRAPQPTHLVGQMHLATKLLLLMSTSRLLPLRAPLQRELTAGVASNGSHLCWQGENVAGRAAR